MTGRSKTKGSVGTLPEKTPVLSSESLLWRACLGQAIRDLYSHDTRIRQEVIEWLVTPDFEEVCDYADVEPGGMREQLYNLARMPVALARKYGDDLRRKVVGE